MIVRSSLREKLLKAKDTKLIKVITGIRRCGKSTLLNQFQHYLLQNGVNSRNIVSINFENPDNDFLTDYKSLYNHIKNKLVPNKMNYIFLDEIQAVQDFQKAVDGLYILENVDLYVTGSNAHLLSGEIATLLSGRYIEIFMLPLSFKEYMSAFPASVNIASAFNNYLLYSSFPYALQLQLQQADSSLIRDYLSGIYNTVVLKDIVSRKNIGDVAQLESIIRFMFDNISNLCSIKKISDTMTSFGRKIATHTVENYLSALTDSYIMHKVGRYDIKGKQYLKTNEKYYLADIGLRYFLLGSSSADFGHILENIVYLELIRRGNKVSVGKINDAEVDFVCKNADSIHYYQVAQSVAQSETLDRELHNLQKIKDSYPKFLLTMDNMPISRPYGITQMNVLDWLLE